MKYSIVRLGTQAYFEGRTRDVIDEKDFEIETLAGTEHIIATSKTSRKRHFVPIFNVAYAEVKEEVQEHFRQNDAAIEIPNEISAGEGADRTADTLPIVGGPEKKGKKSKKN